jgi:DNA-binding response OmpR family regulator
MSVAPARVVVVEDEEAVREAVVRALAEEGYAVAAFADARESQAILHGAPDLAVLDVLLPGGDGFTLARTLRAHRDVPVVFLTARDGVADRLEGFEIGADDYLVKPFALEELLAGRRPAHR